MKVKLFPRNLTAQARVMVHGNPATSRPESGTDVCTPGLEMDLGALEERFFPGLVWDFEYGDGARLADLEEGAYGLTRATCLDRNRPIYLWALRGLVSETDKAPQTFTFFNQEGRAVWRRVRDLAPDQRIAIFVGAGPVPGDLDPQTTFKTLETFLSSQESAQVRLTTDGKFGVALLAAHRTQYLEAETGVIVESFKPGEFTKSLCAPWQLDFRDCGCQYWAAGKPDMVTASDGKTRVDFNRHRELHPNTPDSPSLEVRKAAMYSGHEMIAGAWRDLPVVVADREDVAAPGAYAGDSEMFTLEEAAAELCYLATVEHALLVQYLYAAYSVKEESDDPQHAPKLADWRRAAKVVREIAIDEMRHFLWVNQLLGILGYTPSVDRADVLGANPKLIEEGSCCKRPHVKAEPIDEFYPHFEFKLCRLTGCALDYFIRIEKNSRFTDGMYTRLYNSVRRNPEFDRYRDQMLPVLKLIMDEGHDHWLRFNQVRVALQGSREQEYLDAFPAEPEHPLYRLAQHYYALLLDVLPVFFELSSGGASLLGVVRKLMEALDVTIKNLAKEGIEFQWDRTWAPDTTSERPLERALATLHATRSQTEESYKDAEPPKQVKDVTNVFREAYSVLRAEQQFPSADRPAKKACCHCRYKKGNPRTC